MRDEEFTYLQISNFLNTTNFKPQRTNNFFPQQVFGLFNKMNKRIRRLNEVIPLKIYDFRLITTSKKITNEE